MELTAKRALIVGNDEIGQGIAERFRRAGAQVTILDVNDAPPGDADILVVNSLGYAHVAPLEAQTDDAFSAAMAAVTKAASAMRAVLPHMRERNWGRIVLIGHRYGESVSEGLGPYNSAAWALAGLTRSAAVDWGQYGVTSNLLVPLADTAELRAARERRPKVIDLMIGQVALRRAGDVVEDIGGAALYLAGEDVAFVNGQIVYADGGQHIAGPVLNPSRFVQVSTPRHQ